MDLVKKIMYYFDSTGVPMKEEPHIYKFYEKVKGQDPAYKLVENHPVEHQFGNTECGIYVLFFTIHIHCKPSSDKRRSKNQIDHLWMISFIHFKLAAIVLKRAYANRLHTMDV